MAAGPLYSDLRSDQEHNLYVTQLYFIKYSIVLLGCGSNWSNYPRWSLHQPFPSLVQGHWVRDTDRVEVVSTVEVSLAATARLLGTKPLSALY